MGNRITNAHLTSFREAVELYVGTLDIADMAWGPHAGLYHRLRLVSHQYQAARREIQGLSSLGAIQVWIRDNQLAIIGVPLNFLESKSHRQMRFHDARFAFVREVPDIDSSINRFWIEERVIGHGWRGNLVITLQGNQSLDITTLRQGLDAMGVYVLDFSFSRVQGVKTYTLDVALLSRDFQISESSVDVWRNEDEDEDEDEDISEGEWQAILAEEGYLDDELDIVRTL